MLRTVVKPIKMCIQIIHTPPANLPRYFSLSSLLSFASLCLSSVFRNPSIAEDRGREKKSLKKLLAKLKKHSKEILKIHQKEIITTAFNNSNNKTNFALVCRRVNELGFGYLLSTVSHLLLNSKHGSSV